MTQLLNQADYHALDLDIQSGERNGRPIRNVTSWRDATTSRTVVLLTYERTPNDAEDAPRQEQFEFDYSVNLGPQ